MDAQETKRTKARNLRYKKAIVADVNLDKIREDLYDIMEACDEVRYFFESDDDTLLNALDGNEDEEWEFKMMFCDLSAECEQMQTDLEWEYIQKHFDDFFCAVSTSEKLIGWDQFEGDYFGLGSSYEEDWGRKEAQKRMQRLTKEELMETAQKCFVGYVGAYKLDSEKQLQDTFGSCEVKKFRAVPELRHKDWKKRGLASPLKPDETPDYYFADLQSTLYYTIHI